MAGSLGTIAGQVRLDVASALAGFAAVRASSAATAGSLNEASTRMKRMGQAATGAGIVLVAAFAMAVKAAADFESKLDYFGAVNNATAQEMEAVRQKALELGTTTAYSATQVADAFVEMGKAGVSAKDITDGMAEAIINLASAADIDLQQATNIVTSQIQAYSMEAKDAAHVTDVMAGAANASIIDVTDLGVSLKYVGGVAHGLGISFDSTVDAISLLGKAGIKGSTAGTSLRQIMVSLAGGTNKARKQLKDLGIITEDGSNKFFTAEGKAKSLAEVFQILQDHTADLTDKERLMAFRTIFNNRALAAASILTKEGAKGFAEMNGEISKTTAADVAAKRLDNLNGDIQKLKGTLQTLMIEAGTPFQNFLRGIVQGLTRVVKWFADLPTGVQTGIMAFIGITGVLLLFMGIIALVGGTVLGFLAVMTRTWAAMKLLGAGIRIVAGAMRALAATALMNPYVWIAIAVIALVAALYLLYQRSEKFRAIMDAIGRGIKKGFLAVVDWFKGLPKWFSDRWQEISDAFKVGVDWVKKNWDILLAIFTGPIGIIVLIIRRFGDDIVNFFKAIPGAVSDFVGQAIDAAINFVTQIPYYIGFAIGFVLGLLTRLVIEGVALIASWAVNSYNATITWFQQLPGAIASFFTDLWNRFVAFSIQFTLSLIQWATTAYNSTVEWFQKLPGRVWGIMVDLKNRSVSAWNSFIAGLISFCISAYNNTVTWFQKLPGRVWGILVDMKNRAVGAWNSLVSSAYSFGSSVYNGFTDWVNKIPGAVWGAINNAISAFKSMVNSAMSAAKDFASGLWDGFKQGLGINSPSLIEKQMVQITEVTDQETRKLGGQVRGLQRMAGTIRATRITGEAEDLNTSTANLATKQLISQAQFLNKASRAMSTAPAYQAANASTSYGGASSSSATAQGASLTERAINVQVFNPVAERASDSTARKLRQLSDMGAL